MSIDIEKLVAAILARSTQLAVALIRDYEGVAIADINQFVNDNKSNLVNWTQELASGQLTLDDFNDLVQTSVVDAVMHGIKRSGMKQIEIDKFKAGVVSIITSVVSGAVSSAAKGGA